MEDVKDVLDVPLAQVLVLELVIQVVPQLVKKDVLVAVEKAVVVIA